MRRGAVTIKPDARDGRFVLLDDRGAPVGSGIARPSSVVGYVTLVVLSPDSPVGPVLRVPADWIAELDRVRE